MGETSTIGTVYLWDGTKCCSYSEIPEIDITFSQEELTPSKLSGNTDFKFVAHISLNQQIMRIMCGWSAKGPVRWRQLGKAIRIYLGARMDGGEDDA